MNNNYLLDISSLGKHYPNENNLKIEIIKNDNDNYLFTKIKNIKAIISNNKLETDLRIFKNDEIDNIVDFILREF